MDSMPDLLDKLTAISRTAGDAILEVYQQDFSVTAKADHSPLTEADLAAHRIICSELEQHYPGIPVLSEESAHISFNTRRSWSSYFLVDPLDGTREFVNRNGEFTVNIALISNHRPIAGVVHVPVTGVTYTGAEHHGAFRRNCDGHEAIYTRRPAAYPLIVVGSRSHANPELQQQLEKLGAHELVSMGSSLKFCRVAEGEADFYPRFGPTSEWDTAAAHAIVTAAGGKVVMLDGTDLPYNSKDSLLNPHFLVFGDPERDWAGIFASET